MSAWQPAARPGHRSLRSAAPSCGSASPDPCPGQLARLARDFESDVRWSITFKANTRAKVLTHLTDASLGLTNPRADLCRRYMNALSINQALIRVVEPEQLTKEVVLQIQIG